MNTLPASHHRFPGQLNQGGITDMGSMYLTGNSDSAVFLCNPNDTGMNYSPATLDNSKQNMKDLVLKAVDGKMPDTVWEGQVFNHYPAELRPSADVTKSIKVRQQQV
jgi:hypothetical protein